MTTLHYKRGQWSDGDDPADIGPDSDNPHADMRKLGWEKWLTIGEYPLTPMVVTALINKDAPHPFVIEVEGNQEGLIVYVYADDLADAMDLLGQWGSVAKTAAVVDLLRQLQRADAKDLAGLRTLTDAIAKL